MNKTSEEESVAARVRQKIAELNDALKDAIALGMNVFISAQSPTSRGEENMPWDAQYRVNSIKQTKVF